MKKDAGDDTNANSGDFMRVISGCDAGISPHINNLFDIPVGFTELLDEIAIGVAILSLDRKIVVMNQTLKALTGFSHKDVFWCCLRPYPTQQYLPARLSGITCQ